ncbi:non-ribosomal peptide synthetase [Stakelama sediminis]|nr:non-ribosomal peptide synthetase [Stakelama sediminis]
MPSSVAEAIAAHAAAGPGRPALVADCGTLAYDELNRSADQLANWLGGQGVRSGALLGLCLERSFDQIIAALAAWKAGASYLPLDPAWPDARLRMIAREAECALILGRADTVGRLSGADVNVKLLDWDAVEKASGVPAIPMDPDPLAYVIYTSGTTGKPKGVEITQANLSHLVAWHNNAFGVTARDRGSHLAGLGFDAAVWEVWPYLAAGASVVLAPEEVRTSDSLLRAWLLVQGVTVAFVPTQLAQDLIRDDWARGSGFRYLLTGADRLVDRPAPNLSFQLINNYGPTECTVVSTSAMTPPGGDGSGLPPIGRPIGQTVIRILDKDGKPVEIGAQGEIFIGGPQVARGYRGQPDLTAERFVTIEGERFYRTGDIGACRDDGQFTFHGRVDDQAKVRGHRVEPEETASIIREHPAVRSAAVVAAPAADGGDMLVGYIVADEEVSAEALRKYLGETLPEYMIPSAFVRMDSLPLTANGKLDRKALPEPGDDNAFDSADFAASETPAEAKLTEILEGVLGRGGVGIDDNFFLLGGHSLLGTQVVLRASDAFGVELQLRDLFQAPTIRQLALRIEEMLIAMIESMSDDEAEARASGTGG